MKLKLLVILFALTTLSHYRSFGQATPVSPVPSTTNSAYYEPSTKRIWNYYGNYGWRTFVDSLRLYKILNSYQLKLGYIPVNKAGDTMLGALASIGSQGDINTNNNTSRTFQVVSKTYADDAFQTFEIVDGNISLGQRGYIDRFGLRVADKNFWRSRYDQSGVLNENYMFYDTYNLKFGSGITTSKDANNVWTISAKSGVNLNNFTNGLTTLRDTLVGLGSPLIDYTIIPLNGYSLSLGFRNVFADDYLTLAPGQSRLEFGSSQTNSHLSGNQIFKIGSELGSTDAIPPFVGLSIGDNGNNNYDFILNDDSKQRGLVYKGRYENNFVDSSVVTKRYVDNAIAVSGNKYAIDTSVVHKSGNETISGPKTFNSNIIANRDAYVYGNLYVPNGNVFGNDGTAFYTVGANDSRYAMKSTTPTTGIAPTQVRSNAQSDSAYVIHFATIPLMQQYSGSATHYIVDEPNSGGEFYRMSANNNNTFSRFTMLNMTGYLAVRIYNYSLGIPIMHDPRIVRSSINTSTLVPLAGYTDDGPYIQQILNNFTRKSVKLLFPHTASGKAIVIGTTVKYGQNTTFEGEDAIHPLQTTSDSLKFSPLTHIVHVTPVAFAAQTDSNYRNQAPVFRRLSITGPGKGVAGSAGIDELRNNAYTGSNITYRDNGLALIELCYLQGQQTPINLRTSNDTRVLLNHFQDYSVAVRGGRNSTYMYRNDFFVGDTASVLKGVLNYVVFNIIEPGTGKIGIVGDTLTQTKFIGNLGQVASQYVILKAGSGDISFTDNDFAGAGLNSIVATNTTNIVSFSNNKFRYASSPNVVLTNVPNALFTGNSFTNPLNTTHAAITATGSTIKWDESNFNVPYTDANKFNLTTTTFIQSDTYGKTRNASVTAGYDAYDFGTSLQAPSFKPTATNIGTGYGLQVYNGTGAATVVQFGAKTVEQHTASALGADAAIRAINPTTTGLVDVFYFHGDGRFRPIISGRSGGDMLYNMADGYYGRLGIGSTNQILTVVGGFPAWVTPAFAPINNASLTGTTSFIHLKGNSTTPTVAAGVGAGTGGTATITGSDAAGEITITTGTTPTSAALVATITFNTAYGTAPYIVLQKSSVTTPTDMEIGTRATTNFTITGTLAASTTYKYNYIIVQ